jgi:hypothetical protein
MFTAVEVFGGLRAAFFMGCGELLVVVQECYIAFVGVASHPRCSRVADVIKEIFNKKDV